MQEVNALKIFNLGHKRKSEELQRTAFQVVKKLLTDIHENLIEQPELINKVVAA